MGTKSKNVALTLASGGARGMAHIGAIEELLERGYRITSLSGCSIGSLIGGIYAAGKIGEAREWFGNLDHKQIRQLVDVSLGLNHVVKGNKVLKAIQEWVPDQNIEDLPIPCAFVATDIENSQPVIFREGSLFEAIRASISIPLCFEPYRYNDTLLVDGGLTNPFPLDIIERTEGDILVGVNISGRSTIDPSLELGESPAFLDKMGKIGKRTEELWRRVAIDLEKRQATSPSFNYFAMVNRTVDVQIQANCQLMIRLCKPDIVVDMAQNAYTTFDFDKANEIMDQGRHLMAQALDEYEKRNIPYYE